MPIDLLRLAWLGLIALVLFQAFAAGHRGARRDAAACIALLASGVAIAVLAVNILSRLQIYNAATLFAACIAWPAARWLKRFDWSVERAVRTAARGLVLEVVRRTELPVSSWLVVRWGRRIRRRTAARVRVARIQMEDMSPGDMALAGAAGAAFAAAAYIRFAPVLGEVRLGDPQLYGAVLASRQALFNAPAGVVSTLAAVATALTTAASLHTVHIVRLLGPVTGVAIVVAAGVFVHRVTRSRAAGVIALAVSAATTPQWSPGDAEVAVFFALLGSAALAFRTPASLHAALASGAVAVCALPGSPASDLLSVALPVALAICAGAAFAMLGRVVRHARPIRVEAAAAPLACVALVMMTPYSSGGMFLEYPMAQAKTLEIAATLPRGQWLIVAPVEQLAEAYGRGWYEDPATFVERFGSRAGDPSFMFDYSVAEVMVFVEKRPFKTFPSEAHALPFVTLVDPTYRNYRSLAGRASLQARLLALCEAYSRTHDGASVYYEDDDLAIYRFRLRP
jgi:hypothetical protein